MLSSTYKRLITGWASCNRHSAVMCQVLRMYPIRGKILIAIKSMYQESVVFLRRGLNNVENVQNVGLRPSCVISTMSFNVFIDRGVRKLNVSVVMERAVELPIDNKREWQLNQTNTISG